MIRFEEAGISSYDDPLSLRFPALFEGIRQANTNTGGNMDFLRKLFSKRSPGVVESDTMTIADAIRVGDIKAVTAFLDSGTDVDQEPVEGLTLLMLAIDAGRVPVVELLLQRGADVNRETKQSTPLIRAALRGRKRIVEILLDHGIDVTADRSTEALLGATIEGHFHVRQILLDRGVSPEFSQNRNRTPLRIVP